MRLASVVFRALPLLAVLVAGLGGCSDDEAGTRIYVIVEGGEIASEDLQSVTASVDGRVSRAALEDEPLPRTLILQYEGDGDAGQYRVELTVTLVDGSELVQHVDVMFQPGEAIEVPVTLRQACILSEPCPVGRTCVNDGCADSAAGADGGAADAAPASDAGGPDGATEGGSGVDSGVMCQSAEECPTPSEACMVAACTNGTCIERAADDGTDCGSGMRCGGGQCLDATACSGGMCECSGAERCFVDCAESDSCEVTCSNNATCFVECANAEVCTVHCQHNASCFRCADGSCLQCEPRESCGG